MSQSISWSGGNDDTESLSIHIEDICKDEFLTEHWIDMLDAAYQFIDEIF